MDPRRARLHPRLAQRLARRLARLRGSLRGSLRGWGTARVSGESMRPTLQPGDLLLVRHGACPRIGRLAVVRLPGRGLAVKRVTRREPDGWWVERDNPLAGVDSWLVGAIPDGDVVAVVVCRLWPAIRRS